MICKNKNGIEKYRIEQNILKIRKEQGVEWNKKEKVKEKYRTQQNFKTNGMEYKH